MLPCRWRSPAFQGSIVARSRFTPTGFQFATSPPQAAPNRARPAVTGSHVMTPGARRPVVAHDLNRSGNGFKCATLARSRSRVTAVTDAANTCSIGQWRFERRSRVLWRAPPESSGVQTSVSGVASCICSASAFTAGVQRHDRRLRRISERCCCIGSCVIRRQRKVWLAPTSIGRMREPTHFVKRRFGLSRDRCAMPNCGGALHRRGGASCRQGRHSQVKDCARQGRTDAAHRPCTQLLETDADASRNAATGE